MTTGSPRRQVLFVDDEACSRELLSLKLDGSSFDVTTAASGVECLQLVRQRAFDVILSDVRMPGMDGWEVVSELRDFGFRGPIIMVSTLSGPPNVVRALGAGADDFVTKPFDSDELEARIKAQLRARTHTRRPEDFVLGDVVADKYRLRKFLGAGTYGTVFAADHQRLGITVAVKVLNAEWQRDAQTLAEFMRESALAMQVRHPNLVRVFDADISPGGRPYSVSEYTPGRNLRSRLVEGPLVPEELRALVRALAGGLAAMHMVGVMHRDIKPANILEVQGGAPDYRLGDFGLAVLNSDLETLEATAGRGTAAYMAPERRAGEAHGPASDIFSAGVVIHEALTGQRRWSSGSTAGQSALHRGTSALVERMVDPEPWRRPSAVELMSQWQTLVSSFGATG